MKKLNRRNFLETSARALAASSLPVASRDADQVDTPKISTAFNADVISANPSHAHPNTTGEARLTEGPMVGAVTPSEIAIWARASNDYPVQIEYSKDRFFEHSQRSKPVRVRVQDDLCGVVKLTDLEPDTTYYYRVLVNNESDGYLHDIPPFPVKTAPAAGKAAHFRMAFGSCARFQRDPVQKIWQALGMWSPDIFFSLGDYVYANSLRAETIAETYRRQRRILSMRPFIRSVPQLAIWDDHDYGLNDQDRTSPVREQALQIFKNYWANPTYGLDETPGVFFDYAYGGVDFFFLDGRYYRDPDLAPDTLAKTQLGKAQFAWLKAKLRQSKAPFKVLVSGGGWSNEKGPGGDSWAAFLHERNHLFEFIRKNRIEGVLMLSGDIHIGELNAIPWSQRGGYDFYDLVSSPLAQHASDDYLYQKPEIRIRPAFAKGSNCGIVDFDLAKSDPELTYQLINTRGHSVWSPFVLRASELKNGVESWRSKIDSTSLQRLRRSEQDKGYYKA